jgi:Tol biopolymer transport system component
MARVIVLAALLLALAPAAARADFSFDRTDFDTATSAGLFDVAIADLGGANGPDIVATAINRNKLELLRNQGGGTFAAPVERDACGNGNASPAQIVAGQFDADPVGDVAVACGFVAIVPGGGADGLGAPQAMAWQTRGIVAAGELNGGGATELVFGGPAGGNKAVLCFLIQPFSSANANCGNDPMEPQPPLLPDPLQGFWVGTPSPVVADLVGPATPRHDEVFGLSTTELDAITIYNRAPIAGPGPLFTSWAAFERTSSTERPYFIDVGDIEADGDMDILVGHKDGGHFDLFVNGTAGIPTDAVPIETNTLGFENQAGRLADFDGDGRLDAVIATGGGRVALHRGNGDGTFGGAVEVGVVGSLSRVALEVGDLDGDHDPDIVVVESHSTLTSNTPDKLTVLINRSLPPVTSPPPGPGAPLPSPAGPPSPITGLKALKSTIVIDRKGRAVLGEASNPPTAATSQTVVARRTVLARGRTSIRPGTTKRLVVKLGAKAMRRLKRTPRVTVTIRATGPTGLKSTLRRRVKLRRPARAVAAAKDDLVLVNRVAGAATDNDAEIASMSGNGRYVAFQSRATNLSNDDGDASIDIFVRDLQSDTIVLASRVSGAAGPAGDQDAEDPSISADGRFVAFVSNSDNLSGEDNDAYFDIFVRDLQTTVTSYVSRATGPTGVSSNGDSSYPAISADGRYVAWASQAASLSPDDGEPFYDIFVRDLQSSRTVYVSRATGEMGSAGNADSIGPSVSADGRYVAFESLAANLSTEDTDLINDVFVRDLQTNTTTLVSRASGGGGAGGDGHSFAPSISADGRYVAFASEANNLSGADDNAERNVFVRDLQTGVTTYVNQAGGGAAVGGDSSEPSISAGGRYVAFSSEANNLAADDNDNEENVFVRDLQASTITYVSRAGGATGAGGDNDSGGPSISSDARFVAFTSAANNLSTEDNDTYANVFVRDVLGSPAGPPGAGSDTTGPAVSGSRLTRANGTIRVDRRGRFRLFCGRYSEPVTGTCGGRSVRRKRTLRLGNRAFSAQAGRRAMVRFRLSRTGLARLKRAKRVRMRGVVVVRDAVGNATTARFRFTLKARRLRGVSASETGRAARRRA